MSKYADRARGWSEREYADPRPYLEHRARLVRELGPRLDPGDTVLDLACGDGGLARWLDGQRYRGIDASAEMVAAARERGVDATVGDLNEYAPPEPVAATTVFRAIYYARDRRAFFARAAGYTEKKLVFDLNPRQFPLEDVVEELRGAGFGRVALRPFFVPQTVGLPRAALRALVALERSGPLARALLRVRFTWLVAAYRDGVKR